MLSWSVFRLDFEDHVDVKSLLRGNYNSSAACPQGTLSIVDFDAFDGGHLVRNYFENVHVFNPVLDEAKIQGYMRDARFNGLGWDARSCLLLLVYALGFISEKFDSTSATSSPSRGSVDFHQAESCFSAAQRRMGILLSRTGILEAQCFFLAGVYLMSILRPIEAWRMFVQAMACCQGFHTSKSTADGQLEDEQKLQNSIYWTCFKSELELRLELRISETRIRDFEYPAFFPSPPQGLSSQGETAWYFYLAEIALQRLKSRILYHTNYQYSSAPNSINTDLISNFEHQAREWLHSLPPALSLKATEHDLAECDVLKLILTGHLLDCYEVMYWPFVVEAVNGKSRGGDAGTFVRKGLHMCVERIEKNESGFYHRHHGIWLTLRSCTRSALVILAARRSPELCLSMPANWESAIEKVMAMLRFWQSESRDALDRLKILQVLARKVV